MNRMLWTGRKSLIALVALFAMVCVGPLYWMFTGSFKEMKSTMQVPPELIPLVPTLENYRTLFNGSFPIWSWLLNSFSISALTTVFCILICTMMGYAFSKKSFPLKSVLFVSILITMMLPKQAALIPLFLTVLKFGLMDNILGAIIPLVVWPYGIFMMRQFIQSIPNELLESAKIDGASEPVIFTGIIIPLVKPSITALAVIMFLTSWNDFMWQLIVLKDIHSWTINIGISVISRNPVGNSPTINYGLAMAGGTIGAIPLIIIFIALQKYFVKGLTMGAVKE
ncbi:carbohydrate ABC transporter permease [Paenibacillus eucommiae]|uniref:Multiple sugar transport system permease protein n=1 Tax=Paenibacillus eucommiae TaxID=1355755 RepID=A0ABS4JB06_9BACL|nr:carbohydrate ABC transporter permease [Paenibacillus eucommiae]MBP1996266.1 multiple sugar transport system permease protein [Paenibacillus eucommiae]